MTEYSPARSLHIGIYTDLQKEPALFEQLLGGKSELPLSFGYTWLGTASDIRQQLFSMPGRRLKNMLSKYHAILIEHHRDLDNVTVLINHIKDVGPQLPILLIGHEPSPALLTEWIEAGLDGYFLEKQPVLEIDQALLKLKEDQVPAFSGELAGVLVQGIRLKANKIVNTGKKMSRIQQEICQLIVKGKSYAQIAELLGTNMDKVRYHIKQIYQKHNVNKGTQLIRLLKGL